ncbi:glycoside hydrolase family 3 protein [Asticcacaulis sp. AND118]|uniref:glycoside hydrolase family 3 protein n=1 Tax=Asticcacaulis sp. AND118 TaxID=2840468 RepID=UPI001CFF97E7|nr:glycoside hydrolase family 3 protein [Asticcacaulis sp. AND118]UDF05326.1 glycoside hydrolase family 3 C-terminal domain-containing protein [Asticcacaulis sp. AND118]
MRQSSRVLRYAALRSLTIALCISMGAAPGAQAQNPLEVQPYQDMSRPAESRAADLVARMTLEEKTSQLINDAPAIPRLGVREYNWWNEGLHGVAAAGYATVFPQAVGLAATWDEPLIHQVADTISIEFRAKYVESRHRFGGSDWFRGLTVWSPNINIFRDPRWGRGQETFGEDPYLTARMGVAFIKGLQGTDPVYYRTVATPKHYAVHSGPEASRHRDNINPSLYDLEDTYLPAFRAAITEGKAVSIMCAYNAINGQPACANDNLLVRHLRKDWGFTGFVVSDCDAVGDIYYKTSHHYRATPEEGVTAAYLAGTDLICGNANEADHLTAAVRKGLLAESTLDQALVRLFTARFRLGQFDPPAKVFPAITAANYDTPAHRDFSQRVAESAIVLLKNEGDILPLKGEPKSIAVIGPNANTVDALVGNYNGEPSHPVTILDGLRARYPQARIRYAQGSGLIDPVMAPVPDDALCRDQNCLQTGVAISLYPEPDMTGPPIRTAFEPNARQIWSGEQRSGAVRFDGYLTAPESGEYRFRYDADGGYRIWIDGKLVIDAWDVDWRPSIATGAIQLQAGHRYALRVEAFQRQNKGDETLLWSLPSDRGARDAMDAARDSDLVVFVAGLSQRVEGEEMRVQTPGFSGGDRTSLDLPPVQQKLLEQVTAVGKPVVLVLVNGSALSVNWADKHVPAIVEAWYPGGQGGAAVARLIAGDFSPAGRLPVTFYRSADQLPAFSDYGMKGRTYRYFKGEALYPFGYGLSYTRFTYAPAKLSAKRIRGDGEVTVSVDVTNAGKRDGDEVVQLYVSHPGVAAPVRALARFQRIHLKAGETQTVTFTLDSRTLSTVDSNGVRMVQPGTVKLWIGGGQPDARKGLTKAAGVSTSISVSSLHRHEP